MVDARNANYATIIRHLSFAKRGAPNVDLEADSQGSGKADTIDNGSDSDTEAPEPRLLRVSLPDSAGTHSFIGCLACAIHSRRCRHTLTRRLCCVCHTVQIQHMANVSGKLEDRGE